MKVLPHKSSEWSSLVPGPETKSSSSKITNPTSFIVSYQDDTEKGRTSTEGMLKNQDATVDNRGSILLRSLGNCIESISKDQGSSLNRHNLVNH